MADHSLETDITNFLNNFEGSRPSYSRPFFPDLRDLRTGREYSEDEDEGSDILNPLAGVRRNLHSDTKSIARLSARSQSTVRTADSTIFSGRSHRTTSTATATNAPDANEISASELGAFDIDPVYQNAHHTEETLGYTQVYTPEQPLGDSPEEIHGDTLRCEFHAYTGCDRKFGRSEESAWGMHTKEHFAEAGLPPKSLCWICDLCVFNADDCNGDKVLNFDRRNAHIWNHFQRSNGVQMPEPRQDGHLLNHLWKHGLITEAVFSSQLRKNEATPIPDMVMLPLGERPPTRRRSLWATPTRDSPGYTVEISVSEYHNRGQRHRGSRHRRDRPRNPRIT